MSNNHNNGTASYVAKIDMFSRGNVWRSSYRPLAEFLSKGLINDVRADSADNIAQCFASFYSISPGSEMLLTSLLAPPAYQYLDTESISSACGGRLIFLRGFPSPRLLASLGNFFQVNPEYWRRHLDFLSPVQGVVPHEHPLPSTTSNMFQLRIESVGSRGRWWEAHKSIEDLRNSAAGYMGTYRKSLAAGGLDWKQADSIVRRYVLHDREHFSIEQNVTVYLHRDKGMDPEKWAVIVFLDCGNDLLTSPEGPWLGERNRRNIPRMLVSAIEDPEEILGGVADYGIHSPTNVSSAGERQLRQSLSDIHLSYGNSLDENARARDPFYLLDELFRQDASNESLTLDLISDKVKNHAIGTGSNSTNGANYKALHSQLLHFQSFLEYRIEHLNDKLELVRRRGGASWPRQNDYGTAEVTDSAAFLLIADFEYLLKRANGLLKKIERSITLTMSLANIEEARRGVDQNTTLFRFTVVASFYIPLSFTTSFFGMNFYEFGTSKLSIWNFFAVSIPVFIISVLCLFVRKSWIKRFQPPTQ